MPLLSNPQHDEKSALLEQLQYSITNARDIIHGLTIDQFRTKPVPSSEITLGWLILHISEVASEWATRINLAPQRPEWERTNNPAGYFEKVRKIETVYPADTPETILERYDSRMAEALEIFRSVTNLDLEIPTPLLPWFTPDTPPLNVRWALHHVLEEIHRHSGHGDILREAIDGAEMYDLRAEAEGMSLNFIEDWFAQNAHLLEGDSAGEAKS